MDLEERGKKHGQWMAKYMKCANLTLEEALSLSWHYGYSDCVVDHNLTAMPTDD